MKVLSLTTTLFAALSLTVLAKNHTVKSGDTVSSISRKHKVSISNIMKWNKISDPTKLRIGQSLNVSTSAAKTTSKSKSASYKVAKGDTFYSIARRNKISVTQLRALNPNVSTNRIAPGQTLAVSGKAPMAAKKVEKKPTVVAKVTKKATKKPVTIAKVVKKEVVQKKIEEPAPKKISAAITLAKKPVDPAPEKEAVVAVSETESTPISTPPAPPVVEVEVEVVDQKSTSPSSVASIILTDETTFDAFAGKHGTNTSQLNALNGWNLPKATVLARGSEIYVPQ